MKSAIVTGATGFIGSWLVKELAGNGIKVIAVVRPGTLNLNKIKDIPKVDIIECDMEKIEELEKNIKRLSCDVFYHLAWNGSSGALRSDYKAQLLNVEQTIKAIKTAENLGCKKFIGAGSLMEFESHQIIMENSSKPGLSNIYSTAKYTAHAMSKVFSSNLNIEHIWTYITNAYGEDEVSPRFYNTTLKKMINKERLDFTQGNQMYDFVHVSDVARAFRLIGEKGRRGYNYCIGSGKPRPLKQFIIEMRDLVDQTLELNFGAIPPSGIDLPKEVYSIERLGADTGYSPLISFEKGVDRVSKKLRNGVKGGFYD